MVEIYSPNATWARVKAAAQGAKVLIYLGHGNGSPSPYGALSKYTKDGFGLNATAGAGNSNTKYCGEYYIRPYIKLAPNAVVILNRLCYASGNSEWGAREPDQDRSPSSASTTTAPASCGPGAKAVFAEGITSAAYILYGLFKTNRSIGAIFTELAELERRLRLPVPVGPQRRSSGRGWTRTRRAATTDRSSATSSLTAATIRGS